MNRVPAATFRRHCFRRLDKSRSFSRLVEVVEEEVVDEKGVDEKSVDEKGVEEALVGSPVVDVDGRTSATTAGTSLTACCAVDVATDPVFDE